MAYDFNDAEQQRTYDVIPAGTVATVQMTLRPGGAGEGGWLKRSKDGASEAVDAEFIVVDGPFAKRKFWTLFTVDGATDGHSRAGKITASRLRGILESARGIKPLDQSEAAKKARCIESYGDFDQLRFIARIGVEPATGSYQAKNKLLEAITPDRRDWQPVEQVSMTAAPAAASVKPAVAPAAIGKPAWAR